VVGLSVVGVSAPAFATGIFLLYVFAVVLGWFPVFGQGSGFADRVWHLTLPAIALALTGMALVLRLTRAGMIGALEQDYVAFARARGLPAREVIVSYAFRNALVPVVTAGGLILGIMLTGAVLVEVTFALPGLGSLLVTSVSFGDVPMVQGLAMLTAIVIVLVNLLTDVLYLFVDPRIRYGPAPA
jgi:peptide/nickel transport system permease protein